MAKEIQQIDFLISDESINRYGYRILTDGIDTARFETNPVAYFNHNTTTPAVGKWTKIWKENGQLKGSLQFDPDDELSMKLYHKYKNNYMRAVSLNISPIEESDDSRYILQGQRFPTVVKCELLEVSLVTIPGNGNAVKLSCENGNEYKLSLLTNNTKTMAKEEKTVEQLQSELQEQKKLNADNLIKLHQQRGVVSDGEVGPLKELALSNYDSVSKILEARPAPASGEQTQKGNPAEVLADGLVKLHFDRGAITEGEKDVYKLSAVADYEKTRKLLEEKTGTKDIQVFVQGMGSGSQASSGSDDRAKWTYLDYYKKDMRALGVMEKDEPDKYRKLVLDFESECAGMGIGSINKQ